ncbi:MAG: DUF4198 domain-containing protein [Erythrobacter sp.]
MIRPLLTALALTLPVAATAHTFWLEPEDHSVEANEELRIDFRIGDAGQAGDWGLFWERIASLRLYGPDGVTDLQRGVRVTGAGEAGGAIASARSEGTHIIAFESNPSFSDLEGARFDAYVANEGLAAIAAHREATGAGASNGTELYSRRAKALIQVGDRTTGNVTRPIGHTLEIVPLQNPFALAEGDELTLKVFWRGEPLEGATLGATLLDGGDETVSYTTSADGVVTVPAPGETPVLYGVVWGVPAPNDTRADYITIFASLTVAGE